MTAGGGAERLAPPGLDLVIVLGAPPARAYRGLRARAPGS